MTAQNATGLDTIKMAKAKSSQKVIKHAYNSVIDGLARLASFSTSSPLVAAEEVEAQKDILAIDDLINFSVNARRLLHGLGARGAAMSAMVNKLKTVDFEMAATAPSGEKISIWDIVNTIIHSDVVEIIRTKFHFHMMLTTDMEKLLDLGHIMSCPYKMAIPPLIIMKSSQQKPFCVDVSEVIDVFCRIVFADIREKAEALDIRLDQDDF